MGRAFVDFADFLGSILIMGVLLIAAVVVFANRIRRRFSRIPSAIAQPTPASQQSLERKGISPVHEQARRDFIKALKQRD